MKTFEYYYDYQKDALQYILSSKILRNSEKNILKDILDGKKVRELAIDYNCSERTICRRRKDIFTKTQSFM